LDQRKDNVDDNSTNKYHQNVVDLDTLSPTLSQEQIYRSPMDLADPDDHDDDDLPGGGGGGGDYDLPDDDDDGEYGDDDGDDRGDDCISDDETILPEELIIE
jgi:hypothetical protein